MNGRDLLVAGGSVLVLLLSGLILDRIFRDERPVGGKRGWWHVEGNARDGWYRRWTRDWHDPGGERVRLTAEGAEALRLWEEGPHPGLPPNTRSTADLGEGEFGGEG